MKKKRNMSESLSISDNFGRSEKNLEQSDKCDSRSKFISGTTISENLLTSQDRKFSEKNSLEREYIKFIRKIDQLDQEVASNAKAVFIVLLPKIWKYKKIFNTLSLHRAKTVAIQWGAMPKPAGYSGYELLGLLASPGSLVSKIYNRLFESLLMLNKPWNKYDAVFYSGKEAEPSKKITNSSISIAIPDYDQYRQKLSAPRLLKKEYIVFLDIYLPYHSDLQLNRMKYIDSDRYYYEMNQFFSIMEKKYDAHVVIAAHPKANYLDEYQGREIFSDSTQELCKDAKLVVAHISTSISYAVLNKKPILLVYTDEMERAYSLNLMRRMHSLSAYLGISNLNISKVKSMENIEINAINRDSYKSYVTDFIYHHHNENMESSDIFLAALKLLVAKS